MPVRLGTNTGAKSAAMGFFFTTSHKVAEGYAQSPPYEVQVIRNEYQDLANQVGLSDDEALW